LRQLRRRACSASDSSGSEAREEPSIEVAGAEVDAVRAASMIEPSQAANKAPEPTPGSVTLRAFSRMTESKQQFAEANPARSAPAPVVAVMGK
jgi:hypothetical protein